jgi:hypothetical protein
MPRTPQVHPEEHQPVFASPSKPTTPVRRVESNTTHTPDGRSHAPSADSRPRQESDREPLAEKEFRKDNEDLLGLDKEGMQKAQTKKVEQPDGTVVIVDTLEEEYKKTCWDKKVHHPDGTFRIFYNFFQALVLVWVGIVVPYRIGFSIELAAWTPAWWFEAAVDFYFIVGLILNFFTGYHENDYSVEMRVGKIKWNYINPLTGWFFVDFFSCLPLQ